jgi:tetratricopeptide (TPR) repeat protein
MPYASELMMKTQRIIGLLMILVSLGVGYEIIGAWRGKVLAQRGYSREALLEAARADRMNPEPFYKLGLLHQWNLLKVDTKESNQFLQMAIERNPLEQEYWLNLAKGFLKDDDEASGERALENAITVFPTSYQGRWVVGNVLLQQGDVEGALPHFAYILDRYPNQSRLVYEVWEMTVDDPDFMIEKLVPKDPTSLNQYLNYLYNSGDKAWAVKVWDLKASLGQKANRDEALRHIEFLISQKEFGEAFKVWKTRLREEGLPATDGENLVTNGGFEFEKLLGGGFDWRMSRVAGAEISFDPSVYFEGKKALKLRFNGKENVYFQNVFQYVPLKPKTSYLLRARVKTKGVTTKSGIKLEIAGAGPAFQGTSEGLTGDHDWTEVTVAFQTPAESHGGIVRVKRESTNKFDRFISGEAWIDNVQLTERKSPNN